MMKKLYIIGIIAVLMVSCGPSAKELAQARQKEIGKQGYQSPKGEYALVVKDECEYWEAEAITWGGSRVYSLTHKGNCKFCAERAQKLRAFGKYE